VIRDDSLKVNFRALMKLSFKEFAVGVKDYGREPETSGESRPSRPANGLRASFQRRFGYGGTKFSPCSDKNQF
jgi:hypothetical protein